MNVEVSLTAKETDALLDAATSIDGDQEDLEAALGNYAKVAAWKRAVEKLVKAREAVGAFGLPTDGPVE